MAAYPLRSLPRTIKPDLPTRIDQSNPLTKDFIFAAPFGPNQDLAFTPLQADWGPATEVGSAISTVDTSLGLGIDCTSSANGVVSWGVQTPILDDTAGMTVISFCRLTTDTDYQSMFSHRIGSGGFEQLNFVGNSRNGFTIDSGKFELIYYKGGSQRTSVHSTNDVIDNAFHWYGASLTPNTTDGQLYIDGVAIASTNDDTGDGSGWTVANQNTSIMGLSGGSGDAVVGEMGITLVWNRILTAEEHAEVVRNPWQLFAPRYDVFMFDTAAGGGGTVTASFTGTGTSVLTVVVDRFKALSYSGVGTASQSGAAKFPQSHTMTGTGTPTFSKVTSFVRSFAIAATATSSLVKAIAKPLNYTGTGTSVLSGVGAQYTENHSYTGTGTPSLTKGVTFAITSSISALGSVALSKLQALSRAFGFSGVGTASQSNTGTPANPDPTDFGSGDFSDFLDWRQYRKRRWIRAHRSKYERNRRR